MKSCRVAAAILASLFLGLTASQAAACSCKKISDKQRFSSSDLVVRGRMKLVTYGVGLPDSLTDAKPTRMTRGDFEIDKVLKGKIEGKTLSWVPPSITIPINSPSGNLACRKPNRAGRPSISLGSATT